MMTATTIVQHAAGGTPKMKGGGMLSFIEYENRAISQALTSLGVAGLVASLTDAF